MRISDWSSDVCSSDLRRASCQPHRLDALRPSHSGPVEDAAKRQCRINRREGASRPGRRSDAACRRRSGLVGPASPPGPFLKGIGLTRSEEHTSELQSLMRISYAVFCLKKKTTQLQTHAHRENSHS